MRPPQIAWRYAYLSALRAQDRRTLTSFARVLKRNGGCVRETAKALGIPEQTLWSVARDVPAVRRLISEGGIGRRGVMRYRLRATK